MTRLSIVLVWLLAGVAIWAFAAPLHTGDEGLAWEQACAGPDRATVSPSCDDAAWSAP